MLKRSIALASRGVQSAIIPDPLIVSPATLVVDAIVQMSRTYPCPSPAERLPFKLDEVIKPQSQELFLRAKSGCVLVVADRQVVGILTERDVVHLSARQEPLARLTTDQVMIAPVICLGEAEFTHLAVATHLFQRYRIRYLPILDERQRLVGLVTDETLQQAIADQPKPMGMINQQETQARLLESEQSFISLAKAAPVGIFCTDRAGQYIYVNDRWCEVAGLTPAAAMGEGWQTVLYPEDRERISSQWYHSIQTDGIYHIECRFQRPHGDLKWVYGQAAAQRDADGQIVGYIGTITDIGDLKQAEQKLQQLNQALEAEVEERTAELKIREQFLQTILDTVPLSVFWKDLNSVYVGCNQRFLKDAGLASVDDLVGKTDYDMPWRQTEADDYRADDRHVMEINTAKYNIAKTQVQADGTQIWVETNKLPLHSLKGEVVGLLGTYQDITPRKQAAQVMARQLRAMEAAIDGIAILKEETFLYVNQAHVALFGYECPEDLIGHSWRQLYSPAEVERFEQEVFPLLSTDLAWRGETVGTRRDGSTFAEELSLTLAEDGLLICVCRDICDRKQAEEQQRNLSDRLSLAVQSGSLAIWDWDVIHDHLTWDERMYELYDVAPHQFSGLYDAWVTRVHPEDRAFADAAIQQALAGEQDYDITFRVIHADESVHFIKASALVQRNEQGIPQRMVGLNCDITERKQAEALIQYTTAQLKASNRELESFAYSVSHDLRAPLRGIDGFSQALLEDYGDTFDEVGRNYFDRIRKNVNRMGLLIDDLLNLSRVSRTEIRYTRVNLSLLAQELVNDLRMADPNRHVDVTITPNLEICADVTLMRVALTNLLDNAWKFTSRESIARIEFGTMHKDGHLTYFVRDNGVGFDMAYVNKLFGVFQRLHNTHEFPGTGIGLATVQRVIHRHGGTVEAEGAIEQGATFYFTVPNTSSCFGE